MKKVHFIGIAGTSMRALAEVLAKTGVSVSGTDKIIPTNIDSGITCFVDDVCSHIPESVDTVIFNNTVPENHPEMIDAQKRGITIIPRAFFLNQFTQNRKKFLVTGTDGKTSTSFYLFQLMESLELDPFVLIGTEIEKGKTYKIGQGPYVVEHNEGDLPNCVDDSDILIFTNFDGKDHIWNFDYSKKLMFDLYRHLLTKSSVLIYNIDEENITQILPVDQKMISFGQRVDAEFRIECILETREGVGFDLIYDQVVYPITTKLHGKFSAYNVTAAVAGVLQIYPDLNKILTKVGNLRHAESRFEIVYEDEKKTIYTSMHGSGKSLSYVVDSLKKFEKPISIMINFSETRGKVFFDEFYEVLRHHRFACFSNSYIASKTPESFKINNQEDFNQFLNETDGICIIVHAKYCFHTYIKNFNTKFQSCFD